MKSLILCLSLIWVLGCAVGDDWSPEPIDVESLDLPEGYGITRLGLIMPPGYCEGSDGIPYPCNTDGGGQPGGGGGTGGGDGGGGGDPYATQTVCGDWSPSTDGWKTRTCCEVVVYSGVQLHCWQESRLCTYCGQEPPGGTPPP